MNLRPGSRLRRCCQAPSRSGRCRPAAHDRGAERHGRERTDAAGRPRPTHCPARAHEVAERVWLKHASPGRSHHEQVEAGDRRRIARAYGRATGDRSGRCCPYLQPYARVATPKLRPRRLTLDAGRVCAPAPLTHAQRSHRRSCAVSHWSWCGGQFSFQNELAIHYSTNTSSARGGIRRSPPAPCGQAARQPPADCLT